MQETEETLPDGTVIRRRVTTTRQQQTIVKRVIMEGPENELPTNEDEAEQILQQTDLANEDEVLIFLSSSYSFLPSSITSIFYVDSSFSFISVTPLLFYCRPFQQILPTINFFPPKADFIDS